MAKTSGTAPAIGLVLLLAMLALAAGCQQLADLKEEFDPRLSKADQAYQAAVEPYLTLGVVYKGPATEMKARVLPLTPTVRRAVALRTAQALAQDQAGGQRLQEEAQADLARNLEVVVSLYVPERHWSDLTADKPDWRLVILDGAGQRLEPIDIRLIREKERSALNQTLYYFWGPWDRLFLVRFAAPQAPPARLLVTGALGLVEIPLKLD
ncbi:Lipoprotein [Desulfarculales bacterium]